VLLASWASLSCLFWSQHCVASIYASIPSASIRTAYHIRTCSMCTHTRVCAMMHICPCLCIAQVGVTGEDATIMWMCETDGSQSPNDLEAHSCQWHEVHTRAHTHTQTQIHIFTCKHTPTLIHTHLHRHAHTHTHTHAQPHAHARTHTHTQTHMHTHTHKHKHTIMKLYIFIYVYTHIHV